MNFNKPETLRNFYNYTFNAPKKYNVEQTKKDLVKN